MNRIVVIEDDPAILRGLADNLRLIQERLVPAEIPQISGLRIAGTWRPARIVSGDYFDVLKLDGGTVAVCIADVCGKGMPAAMMMSNLQAAVKACASKQMHPPQSSATETSMTI